MAEERKLQFDPRAALEKTQKNVEIHNLTKRIKELEEAAMKHDSSINSLSNLLDQMNDVNVNMHPLKANVLQDWRDNLGNILFDLRSNQILNEQEAAE